MITALMLCLFCMITSLMLCLLFMITALMLCLFFMFTALMVCPFCMITANPDRVFTLRQYVVDHLSMEDMGGTVYHTYGLHSHLHRQNMGKLEESEIFIKNMYNVEQKWQ